jgi:hypothetical protein
MVAAAGSFCPTMALLGAKRPQDRGWRFVVLALWGILSLPAAYWLLIGGVRDIHPAQLGFLAILVGVGAINGLATRLWPSALSYAAGQAALLAPLVWPTQPWLAGARGPLAGMALIVAAWMLTWMRMPAARGGATPWDRLWLDFRDEFGAVWGLRVMERMNAAATMYGWPVILSWSGFRPRSEEGIHVDIPPAVEDSMRTLLRRFVSPDWIDARLHAAGAAERAAIAAGG